MLNNIAKEINICRIPSISIYNLHFCSQYRLLNFVRIWSGSNSNPTFSKNVSMSAAKTELIAKPSVARPQLRPACLQSSLKKLCHGIFIHFTDLRNYFLIEENLKIIVSFGRKT